MRGIEKRRKHKKIAHQGYFLLTARWFAVWLAEKFFRLDFITETIDWGDVIVFVQKIHKSC